MYEKRGTFLIPVCFKGFKLMNHVNRKVQIFLKKPTNRLIVKYNLIPLMYKIYKIIT